MNPNRLVFLGGMAMTAFLDFSVGTFLAVVIGRLMGIPIHLWYIPIGGLVALAPDILQIALSPFKKNSEAYSSGAHEEWSHWPIPMIGCGVVLGYLVGDWYGAVLAFFCLLFHYSHDMEMGDTGGIPFFIPFTSKYFSWWRGFYDPATSAMKRPENLFEPWVRRNWLRPSAMSLREIGLGTIAFSFALGMAISPFIGILTFVVCWTGSILVWYIARRENM